MHLMEYLSYRPSLKLKYNREYVKGLDGFTDSDWGNRASRKSTSGHLARYNRSLLMWRSKMQKSIALSTAEAEYYSVSEMAIEMIYLRNLLANMGLPQEDYTEVFQDNTNHVFGCRERAKHIDISKRFETVQKGHTWLYQIWTEHQLDDILTKPLQLGPFERCRYSLLAEDPPRRDDGNFLED